MVGTVGNGRRRSFLRMSGAEAEEEEEQEEEELLGNVTVLRREEWKEVVVLQTRGSDPSWRAC